MEKRNSFAHDYVMTSMTDGWVWIAALVLSVLAAGTIFATVFFLPEHVSLLLVLFPFYVAAGVAVTVLRTIQRRRLARG